MIGNTAPIAADDGHTRFAETRPISTYLFAFAAGPFSAVRSKNQAEPTLYVRKSQLARAEEEAPQVQQMAARGIAYLMRLLRAAVSVPQVRPGPDSRLPVRRHGARRRYVSQRRWRSVPPTPTQSDHFRRDILVLHETCHQWFGDMVTMRWFDDLWLKEGFAQYMAYKALEQLDPASNPWKHFYEDIKPLAYGIDETQGTTPIFQNIANLKDAKSAYGAIVYEKAPAVLKQLNYFLDENNFRQGLRLYLKEHAYANAEWADLVRAFEAASDQAGHHVDVQAWAKSWITRRGMPEVTVDYSCNDGKISAFTIKQRDVLDDGYVWPMANEILLISAIPNASAAIETMKVQWNAPAFPVSSAVGKPCPNLVFANERDYGYGRFLLDPSSESFAASLFDPESPHEANPSLLASVSDEAAPLRRTMLWGALWDYVHVAKAPPRGYVELALKSLPEETDESLARIQGARVAEALHSYLHEAGRHSVAPRAESVIADRMLNAPTLGLRIVNFRTFRSIAETPAGLQQVKDLLSGKLVVPGLTLKRLDRWELVGHLIAMGDPQAEAILADEKARDHSGEGQKYAYAAQAGTPTAANKARYFDEYLHSQAIQEDWITESLRPFNFWKQTALTEPYLIQSLNELPDIKQHRKIFFLMAWLGAFIEGQNSAEAQAVVQGWLDSEKIDPDLRLKVLEVFDSLERTVLIRKKFPD